MGVLRDSGFWGGGMRENGGRGLSNERKQPPVVFVSRPNEINFSRHILKQLA